MKNFFLLFVLAGSIVSAKDFCIIAFSSANLKSSDKELFMQRYPQVGTIEKYNDIYECKIYTHKNYSGTKTILEEVRKNYRDAFIINCDSSVLKNTSQQNVQNITSKIIAPSNTEISKKDYQPQIVALEEKNLNDVKHSETDPKKVAEYHNTPALDEPIVLNEHEIPDLYKTDEVMIYDNLSFKRYMDALFEQNDKAEEAFYQQKIDSLLVEIKKDAYNFDVYTDGYLRTGRSVPAQGGGVNVNGDYTGTGVAVHANKLLWDGGYDLINNTYDILNNRLAQIKELNAKDKLAVMGTTLYSNLYTSQEELQKTEDMYKKQLVINEMINDSYKSGKVSVINYIDSKNDLLQLKKTIMRLKQIHLHNDYILRHSIESKSTKPYMLSAPKVNLDMTSLSDIEKEALTNSSDVAIESNILKVKKADLLFQKRRFYPEIRFNSHLGYGMGNLDTFDLSNSGNGDYWDFGLTFKMPIYNRNDINLNEEKEEYEIMKQKSVFSSKQREILIQVDNYYGNINRINEERNILQEQYELMDKKLTVSKEQFVSGLAEYRDYANAMRDYLDYTSQYMQMEQQYIQSVSILSILIGKKEFYEQD
ncbi:MAG TPA: hypothetical protein CFH84_07830 [Sulfurimonas sp. UBA12504]|nr:MAG: hypothetical protein A2019_07720 [Sulfurimonas sp. GWF2_37_8]DAB29710.1 MAG TPA: hypothetical protein CFH84_07830 [Sulfurimonas sp. UBA12504]